MKINTLNSLKLILIFMMIGATLMFLFRPEGMSIAKIIAVIFFYMSLFLLFYYFIENISFLREISIYFQITYLLLLIWIMFTILRSVSSSVPDMITLVSHFRVGALCWLTPLAIFYGIQIKIWKVVNNLIPKLLIIGFIMFIICFTLNIDLAATKYWLLFSIFSLLTFAFYSKRNKYIIVLAAVLFLFVSFTISQRANFLFMGLIILFVIVLFFQNKNKNLYKKILLSFLFSIICLIAVTKVPDYYNELSKDREASNDTRTFLFVELLNDLKDEELIIGKGALGSYYSRFFFNSRQYNKQLGRDYEGDSSTRVTSEVGYLFMILKGGGIMIILHLLIMIPAIFLGFFKSNNLFVKGLSLYVLSYIIMWGLSYTPEFLPEFVLLWLAVGGCISRELRNKSDTEVYQLINQRNLYGN